MKISLNSKQQISQAQAYGISAYAQWLSEAMGRIGISGEARDLIRETLALAYLEGARACINTLREELADD